MDKPTEYNIDRSDEELCVVIRDMKNNSSDKDFSDFCNISISRAAKCWQSGLENYAFGGKNYSDWQSKKTVLEMLKLEKSTGAYNREYVLYVKESVCMYYNLVLRENKLKRILKKIWNEAK